jgi:hypothetical protein
MRLCEIIGSCLAQEEILLQTCKEYTTKGNYLYTKELDIK